MHGLHGMPMTGLGPAHAAGAAPQPRLVRAAHEFEAQLMKELLKPLEDSDNLTGEDADSEAGSAGALGKFATETLGQALSEQGGLGIADELIRTLSRNGTNSRDEKVINQGNRNTGLSSAQ
ncbi:MAG TPA: hypothetical protein VG893_08720 [Terracidiphilus sp.]|nr:hypothetical protein [Terracidiphilus sp.]